MDTIYVVRFCYVKGERGESGNGGEDGPTGPKVCDNVVNFTKILYKDFSRLTFLSLVELC